MYCDGQIFFSSGISLQKVQGSFWPIFLKLPCTNLIKKVLCGNFFWLYNRVIQKWGHTNQPTWFYFHFFQVRGGIYRQNSLVFSETVRKLESIYIYPEYNDRNILHDIALAKLDRPFDMDTFTASVCMPPKLNLFADKGEIGKILKVC